MKILKFVVEGYRSLASFTWTPADLNVVRGARTSELQRALWLFSNLARGWGTFADAMAAERADEADFWHPDAIEVRMFALCAPRPDAELDYGHEVIVERVEAKTPWLVGYERATLSDAFDVIDVLERMGDRVEYTPPRKKLPGMPSLAKAKTEISRVANDMTTFSSVANFRRDARVGDHIEAIASWQLPRARPGFGEGAPARRPTVPMGFHGALDDDGGNLVNLLSNVRDWHDTRRRFDRYAREVVPGYDDLVFVDADGGEVAMELRTRDGRRTPHHALPEGVLRSLAVYGALLSPEPPTLLWLDDPTPEMDPWAAANVAELALEAARRTQVVIANPSPDLARRLDEVSRLPGETRRGTNLTVGAAEV